MLQPFRLQPDNQSAAAMRIDIITIFPGMLRSPLEQSILGRAMETGLLDLRAWDLRDWSTDQRRTVDDYPYGGGPGMVMKPEPWFSAVEALSAEPPPPDEVILLTPLGVPFTQRVAEQLAAKERLMLLCGRYEGVDERVHTGLATMEISIGDYVLTGGELAALVIVDAVVRLRPGVLGDDASAVDESFSEGLLEYPHYTRPASFRGMETPPVLLGGNHGAVERWRREQALDRTLRRRPDLFLRRPLSPEDLKILGLAPPRKRRRR